MEARALERRSFPGGGVLAIGLELGDLTEQRRALLWGMEGVAPW